MSTIDNGHLEVGDGGEEGAEKASLVRRLEGVDLHAGAGGWGFGCAGGATLRHECQSDSQMAS